jgi:hypothetical protein
VIDHSLLEGQPMSKAGKNDLKNELKPPSATNSPEVNASGDRDRPFDKSVDQAVQNHLGRKLKANYDDLVQQPVPDKFRQLLDELERQEKK